MKQVKLKDFTTRPKMGRNAKVMTEQRQLKGQSVTLIPNGKPQKIIRTEETTPEDLRRMGILFPQSKYYIELNPDGFVRFTFDLFEKCELTLDGHTFQYKTVSGYKPAAGYLIEKIPDTDLVQVWEYTGLIQFIDTGILYTF